MADGIRFEHRMSDSDALMWHMEKDPLLRSTITVLWVLDRAPDPGRMRDKVERATRAIPRLRQRVVSNPLSIAPPRWETDPHFDLRFHVRSLRAPGDGSMRAVFDMMAPITMQGFDRARPLWELYVVDGLAGGAAALVMKLHHSLSDGVGLVHMTNRLVERTRTEDPGATAAPMPPLPPIRIMGQLERVRDAMAHEGRRQLGRARRVLGWLGPGVTHLLRSPLGTGRDLREVATSIARLLRPVTEPLSPIMRGRSLSVRFDQLALPLETLHGAAKRTGGKLNDAFVAGVAGGLRRYHERHGEAVTELRMSMPINLREGENANRAGNQFVPARFRVPVGTADPRARMVAIRDLVSQQRGEPGLTYIEDISSLLNRLPVSIATTLFGTMLKGVDFVTSNVPGPRFEVYTAGARIEAVIGFGPLAGAALNVTLFSYRDRVYLGVASDPAAVPDPEVLLACLQEGFAEVLPGTRAAAGTAAETSPRV
jgi:WS/DGAT/MGAT family acyltransferase